MSAEDSGRYNIGVFPARLAYRKYIRTASPSSASAITNAKIQLRGTRGSSTASLGRLGL